MGTAFTMGEQIGVGPEGLAEVGLHHARRHRVPDVILGEPLAITFVSISTPALAIP